MRYEKNTSHSLTKWLTKCSRFPSHLHPFFYLTQETY